MALFFSIESVLQSFISVLQACPTELDFGYHEKFSPYLVYTSLKLSLLINSNLKPVQSNFKSIVYELFWYLFVDTGHLNLFER